jgi:protein-L-isoaspartate(D-aspartate) O-methyltransferase
MEPAHASFQRLSERLVARLQEEGISDAELLSVMGRIPRHVFVDEALNSRAYENTALPIGYQQTISQPVVVAQMTQALLECGPIRHVLEIGTGCGYQTAILATLAHRVFTVERIKPLQDKARERLAALGFNNIEYRHGDGFLGWSTKGPFDAIVVTAAPAELPQMLVNQLSTYGGRLVIPVGDTESQILWRVRREAKREQRERLGLVKFVPLVEGITEG